MPDVEPITGPFPCAAPAPKLATHERGWRSSILLCLVTALTVCAAAPASAVQISRGKWSFGLSGSGGSRSAGVGLGVG